MCLPSFLGSDRLAFSKYDLEKDWKDNNSAYITMYTHSPVEGGVFTMGEFQAAGQLMELTCVFVENFAKCNSSSTGDGDLRREGSPRAAPLSSSGFGNDGGTYFFPICFFSVFCMNLRSPTKNYPCLNKFSHWRPQFHHVFEHRLLDNPSRH